MNIAPDPEARSMIRAGGESSEIMHCVACSVSLCFSRFFPPLFSLAALSSFPALSPSVGPWGLFPMALRPPSLLSLPCMRARARVALRVSPSLGFTCFRCGCRAPRRVQSMGERPCTEADVRASLLEAQPAFRFPDGKTENDFVPEFFAALL